MAIEQHPLPQDVTGYRFRLIGDMTLKQFLYLGVAVLLTLLFHQIPLPFFFRYPLEIVILLLGIGLAFVPVEGRPLDKWLIAFIKSIYSPTQYVWQKQPVSTTSPTKTTHPQKTRPTKKPKAKQEKTTHQSLSSIKPTSSPSSPPSPKIKRESIKPQPKPTPPPPQSSPTPVPPTPPKKQPISSVTPPTPTKEKTSSTSQSPTTQLPIPFTPTTPNTLVGLTLTPDTHILDSALIEIVNNGLTVRATKSNKLGQFLFAKPLENGLYQIRTERDGYQFNTYSIKLDGQIVKPLKIQAQPTTNQSIS